MPPWAKHRHAKRACAPERKRTPFCRLEGIFPGRLIRESLKLTACVIGNGIAVNGATLIHCFFQSQLKSGRPGSIGFTLPRVAVFALCFRSLGNYLNPVHFEIRNSVCCVNPSLAAFFNSVC